VSRKITELEKRALQAQMNPHFIYNCMNSIQQFMVVHDFEGAMKYLTRFSRILRAVLNMSAQSRVSLTDEIKLIEDYLELENMRFPNKFSYRIDVDPKLNVHTVEIPPFFIQPQVENAIRHGLLRKEGGGELVLRIAQEGTYLKVAVEDNGIGRRASMAVRIDETHRESKGLSIVEERLSHLHQANGIHPLTITDLYDTANNPAGTRVEVYLPLDH
jgi:LytS/YehU family sensor histidine kinase